MQKSNAQEFEHLYSLYQENLKLQGKVETTIAAYSRAVRRFAEFFDYSIIDLKRNDMKRYFGQMIDNFSWGKVNTELCAVKFFWKFVIEKPLDWDKIVKPQNFRTLPDVLSLRETTELLKSFRKPCYRALFFTIYSMGLRISEALNLRCGDIDSDRMFVHIRCSKRNKDRYVPLPEPTLEILRDYWKTHRNRNLLFPLLMGAPERIRNTDRHMTPYSVQSAIRKAVEEVGIKKKITTHSLRHCYATHLLEAGLTIPQIKANMGHSSVITTLNYLQITKEAGQNADNVIEQIISAVYSEITK